jgi:hypothetical protein
MEVRAMRTDEPMTETPTHLEPVLDGPVIVSSAAPGGIVQPDCAGNGTAQASEAVEPGLEGEETVCEGHYSPKNFLGRVFLGGLFVVAWLTMVIRTWTAPSQSGWFFWTTAFGICLLIYWLNLGYRYLRAYRGHHYRLTTRRLFVTTGFFQRRVDQLELLRIKDVYIQVSMIGDWLDIGNVVVISSEQTLPKAHLLGIEEPRRVMDLIWHYMRLEQDKKTTRIHPT